MNVYSKLKIFHFPHKLNSLTPDRPITAPIHVRLKPTNACNHHCHYCAYRQPDFQLGETMDERDSIPGPKMLEIVDDLVDRGVHAVTFSGGGDPFVYPHLLDTAQRLYSRGVKFASLTNGVRLTGGVAGFFARYASWVRVSMDGWDGPSYAKYRGVSENEFDKVLGNMTRFRELGGPCALSVVINVDKTNAAHVYSLIKTLAEVGIRSVKVAPIIQSNVGEENYLYHKPHVKTVRRQVALAKESFPQLEIGNNYSADLGSFIKTYTWCPALQIRPVIGADLNVYSCQDKAYSSDGLLFSIKEQSFRNGWMSGDWRYKIDPSWNCNHHCAMDGTNKLIHEYLDIDGEHKAYA